MSIFFFGSVLRSVFFYYAIRVASCFIFELTLLGDYYIYRSVTYALIIIVLFIEISLLGVIGDYLLSNCDFNY